jgi:hypothetical protein
MAIQKSTKTGVSGILKLSGVLQNSPTLQFLKFALYLFHHITGLSTIKPAVVRNNFTRTMHESQTFILFFLVLALMRNQQLYDMPEN